MQERMVSALSSRGALAARFVDDPDNAHRLATDSRVVAWAERHKNPDGYEDAASEYEDDAGWSTTRPGSAGKRLAEQVEAASDYQQRHLGVAAPAYCPLTDQA
jgi:hypothetical protein